MVIDRIVLGDLDTNSYLVSDRNGKGIIIDPGDDANCIIERIIRAGIQPEGIVATHGHFDHILAAWELQIGFNIPFYADKDDISIINQMQSSASRWLNRKIVERPPCPVSFLAQNQVITFGKESLKVIRTPGHSPGSICLYSQKRTVLFTGDTLFANAIGRTDLPYSSNESMAWSIEMLSSIPAETQIYPGHGNLATTTIGESLRGLPRKKS